MPAAGRVPAYAELQAISNFSFLRGASHPEELVSTAAALGLDAIALADRHSVSGLVRAHVQAKQSGIRLVVGARLDFADSFPVLCLPTTRAAYGRMTRLLTLGKRRAPKGECLLDHVDLFAHAKGQALIALAPERPDEAFVRDLARLRGEAGRDVFLAASMLYRGDDARRMRALADLADRCRTPLVATNDVHAHTPGRRPLQDVLTCIREGCTVETAGFRLFANAERHLKPPAEMARLFRDFPGAVARTAEIAAACAFSLDELRYDYPADPLPEGRTAQDELARLARAGARERYPGGVPVKVRDQVEHELRLIDQLRFAPYFLTVHDIVRFARDRGILCQGRGSAANSAVCYCLGITAVDPDRVDVLFERFVSAARDEPPDIDIDFESARREEVIQYVYGKYRRDRSGMTATVITYRTKSAVREVGKALGLTDDAIQALQGALWRRTDDGGIEADVREAGLDPADATVRATMLLAGEIAGFPRHLSQHTGGMVITAGRLDELVPIANAAMEDRTVIEWDKDDLDALGILKIDLLGLGMLSCIAECFRLIAGRDGPRLSLADIPAEDPAVYDMLSAGDSIGVFQVESRAQMSMLPRLKPRCFYDLVIEVAIVRPGPIQGDMVHPYLRRRSGAETVEYPSEELRSVLGKTLGVPLFQEQAMQIAIVAAGFTPTEADGLRRAMATFRRAGTIETFREKFVCGMVARGYEAEFAKRCFKQIEGFAEYGFPESHAASFALLVYVSAWLKRRYPAAFACALLNNQPMGFYAPAQIVRDAREHGVRVLGPDVNVSGWDSTLSGPAAGADVRLGLGRAGGLGETDGLAIEAARDRPFADVADLARRAALGKRALEALARADAFGSMGLDRREALWQARGLDTTPLPLLALLEGRRPEPAVRLPATTAGEAVVEDYRSLGLSLRTHPLALLRDSLTRGGFAPCASLNGLRRGRRAAVAGLVTARQRPGSAKGVIFMTVEDEAAIANLIVWPHVFERFRRTVLTAPLLGVEGRVQREGGVIHLLVERAFDLSLVLSELTTAGRREAAPLPVRSRDFQ